MTDVLTVINMYLDQLYAQREQYDAQGNDNLKEFVISRINAVEDVRYLICKYALPKDAPKQEVTA